MSKSKLTRNIEEALKTYAPAKLEEFELNYHRKQYIEYEIPCLHSHINNGIVDAVWLAEGFNNHTTVSCCQAPSYLKYSTRLGRSHSCDLTAQQLKDIGSDTFYPCDQECFYRKNIVSKQEAVAIICFEIKISAQDFKSKNGHNFIGNLNYYVMPYELFKSIKDEIPANIGVITYHGKDENVVGRLRHSKSCVYNHEVNQELYNSLLHTFLNRKDKQIKKARNIADSKYHNLEVRACAVIQKLIKRLKYEIGDKSCYQEGWDYCVNAKDNDKECKQCPFNIKFRLELESRLHKDEKEY